MIGVIVVAHGSRIDDCNSIVRSQAGRLQKLLGDDYLVVAAFRQFAGPTLAEASCQMLEAEINKIIVQPYFLFTGVHAGSDLTCDVEAIKKDMPQLNITLGYGFDDDERLAVVLADKIRFLK